MPGSLRRLLRQPLRVVAMGLLAVTVLAASGIHSAAALALQRTLDENWRGVYDILVTPRDAVTDVGGMLPPNALTTSEEGITIVQWEQVSALDGVEVAAPIGEVLVPPGFHGGGTLIIPAGAIPAAKQAPQGFHVTVTYTTDDGLGERIVDRSEFELIVDETPLAEGDEAYEQCLAQEWMFRDYLVDSERYPALVQALCASTSSAASIRLTSLVEGQLRVVDDAGRKDYAILYLLDAPRPAVRVTVIDPVSERALLGEAGGFLDPLVAIAPSRDTRFSELRAWAEERARDSGQELDGVLPWLIEPQAGTDFSEHEGALEDVRRLYRDNGGDFDRDFVEAQWAQQGFVPVLVAENEVAPLTIKVDIAAVGEVALTGWPEQIRWPNADFAEPGVPVGNVAADVAALLNPLVASPQPVPWPGTDATSAATPWGGLASLRNLEKLQPSGYVWQDGRMVWEPSAYTSPMVSSRGLSGESGIVRIAPTVPGAEAAYSAPRDDWIGAPTETMNHLAAVGTFDTTALGLDEDAAIHVPLGAYDPVTSTVSAGPHAGKTMSPGVTGLGLVSARTAALASIHSAQLWQDAAPINAIRVRVSDIDAYTPGNRERVIAVAQRIEALGLSAAIVAGSSPAGVDIAVEGYAFGTDDPDSFQTVGPLGTITQRWSELGAAARVALSVSESTLAILAIALAASVLLLGAVQIAGTPGRREQAAVMRDIGFTRGRIIRWFAGEEIPGIVMVLLIGVAALWIAGGTRIALAAAGIVVAVVLLAAIASVVAGSQGRVRTRVRDARSRRLGARSVAAFGMRQALVHPLTSLVHLLSIVLVGLSAAALSAAAANGWEAAGTSNLALLALGRHLAPQLALGVVGMLCGILLARLARRIDLARRSPQWELLRAAGWAGGQLVTAQRMEGVAIVVPALVITAGLVCFGALRLDLLPAWIAGSIAVAAGLATALLTFSAGWKGSTS